MAKFQGSIGFVETQETSPGVHEEVETELPYTGDILRNYQSYQQGEGLNRDVNINSRFSIVSDPHILGSLKYMKYVVWNDVKWTIKSFEIERPRLILYVGGVYNG